MTTTTPAPTTPLNPWLHAALTAAFGDVRTDNAGRTARTYTVPPAIGRRFPTTRVTEGGEHYRVCCPHCRDTRFRLSIHYLWGTFDLVTDRLLLHLVNCFNAGCFREAERRQLLHIRLRHVAARLRLPQPGVRAATEPSPPASAPAPITLPAGFVPLTDPACPDHVRDYVRRRGFDPVALARTWGVGYSRASQAPAPVFRDRLVIPIHDVRRSVPLDQAPARFLAGWQARQVGDDGASPKYLTAAGMPRSSLLYGYPKAVATGTGPIVVVEGVTDVWRLGWHAVALLGKTMSRPQQGLLAQFRGRPLVVFLDGDAAREATEIRDRLLNDRGLLGDDASVVIAGLPIGRKDVGDCGRREAWDCVARALGLPLREMPGFPGDTSTSRTAP